MCPGGGGVYTPHSAKKQSAGLQLDPGPAGASTLLSTWDPGSRLQHRHLASTGSRMTFPGASSRPTKPLQMPPMRPPSSAIPRETGVGQPDTHSRPQAAPEAATLTVTTAPEPASLQGPCPEEGPGLRGVASAATKVGALSCENKPFVGPHKTENNRVPKT